MKYEEDIKQLKLTFAGLPIGESEEDLAKTYKEVKLAKDSNVMLEMMSKDGAPVAAPAPAGGPAGAPGARGGGGPPAAC